MAAYSSVWWLCKGLVHVFFSRVQVTNANLVPATGPVIFYGNHQNQFVDAMLLFSQTRRAVSFLMAASSYAKYGGALGAIARAMRAIPVRRRIDEARAGTGLVRLERLNSSSSSSSSEEEEAQYRLIGQAGSCDFTAELSAGCQVDIKGLHGVAEPPTVIEVLSKEEAVVGVYDGALSAAGSDDWRAFRVLPKINQSEVFEAVVACLQRGECIGIFPEGGSHDRSDLLPLKSGIAVMALKAAERGDCQPVLMPVGLNYFSGHRFRSRVIIEFGRPLTISAEIMALYRRDKRAAAVALMHDVEAGLRSVTVNIPSYKELALLSTVRRLYQPDHVALPPAEYMRLNRRFVVGYTKFLAAADAAAQAELAAFVQLIDDYRAQLDTYGVTDAQLADDTPVNFRENAVLLLLRALLFLVLLVVALPATVVNLPVAALIRWYSNRQAAAALAKSAVKISGRDVIASNKIILGFFLIPLTYLCCAVAVAALFGGPAGALCLLVLPVASLVSVKFMENGLLIWKSSLPIIFALLFSDYRAHYERLKQTRRTLQQIVRQKIEELGPQVGKEFWDDRVLFPAARSSPSTSNLIEKLVPIRRSWLSENVQLVDPTDPFISSMLENETEII